MSFIFICIKVSCLHEKTQKVLQNEHVILRMDKQIKYFKQTTANGNKSGVES